MGLFGFGRKKDKDVISQLARENAIFLKKTKGLEICAKKKIPILWN